MKAASVVVFMALAMIVTAGTLGRSQLVHVQNDDHDGESRIERGLDIAPSHSIRREKIEQ